MKTEVKYRMKSILVALEVGRRIKTDMGIMIIPPAEKLMACRLEILALLLTINPN